MGGKELLFKVCADDDDDDNNNSLYNNWCYRVKVYMGSANAI